MNGRRMPRIFDNNRNIVYDNVKMVRAKNVSTHGSQRDNPGRPTLADKRCGFFCAYDLQLEQGCSVIPFYRAGCFSPVLDQRWKLGA
jgi:hypothetical protein